MAKGYNDPFLQQIQIRPYGQKVSPQKSKQWVVFVIGDEYHLISYRAQ